ncbi:cytochrome d ubiquinol oxidase subunit II [Atopobacter phocae]|uniref:cytochrome d ubiquinol oxidase subunit II n=1 Tax=Atopobacter phocae TaxID=136492 RepID=UPI000471C722|nr:cytochrome d ubiquinol oxidase subunit II [Atopobacter phocae]
MSVLQIAWFVLISVLFSGFFFLEGFDFGVGMAVQSLARNKHEKDQIIETIGPVWDGNEVWLLTAGGAMFASFPYWYASLFSGYYLVLLAILFGLIIRGVSFEFRHHMPEDKKEIWNWTLSIGSLIVPFCFGIMFISLIQGMPLDANHNMSATFSDYINIFSLVGGVALTLLCYLHGLNYIGLKTTGPIRERANQYAKVLYYVLYAGLVVFAVLLYLMTDFFANKFIITLALVVLIVLLTVGAHVSVINKREGWAFILSGLTLISLVALLFSGLFPRVLISSISPDFDLLIKDATSTSYTLKTMSMITATLLPFVLTYISFTYYVFRKRVKHTHVEAK